MVTMTIHVPVWILWALGIVAGGAVLYGVAYLVAAIIVARAVSNASGRGLGW